MSCIGRKLRVTHICLNVLVLKVECMLPDVNTNDGCVACTCIRNYHKLETTRYITDQRVLVGSSDDLEFFRRRVVSLYVMFIIHVGEVIDDTQANPTHYPE